MIITVFWASLVWSAAGQTCTGAAIAMLPLDSAVACAPDGSISSATLQGNKTYCAYLWGEQFNCNSNSMSSGSLCYVNSMADPSNSGTPISGCFFAQALSSPGYQIHATLVFAMTGDSGTSTTACTLSVDGATPLSKPLSSNCAGNCNLGASGGSAVVGMKTDDPSESGFGCLFYLYSQPCPAGYFCSGGDAAALCPMGSYCLAGSSAPTLCPAGSYGGALGLSSSSCSGSCPGCCSAGTTAYAATCSQTVSLTATGTPSTTGSPSQTSSGSATVTCSITVTDTGSPTPSLTLTPSPSITASSSASGTPSMSESQAVSPSQAESDSPTVSETQSSTPSLTSSSTGSGSTSQAATDSSTETPSQSSTRSSTGTSTGSQIDSPSPSSTQTQLQSPSHSQTTTQSASGIGTRRVGWSFTVSAPGVASAISTPTQGTETSESESRPPTRSRSHSSTLSPSRGQQDASASPGPSQTAPETQSQQPTAGVSRSPSPSASPSPTPAPYALAFSRMSGGGGETRSTGNCSSGALRVLLSDSLPLGSATPLLSRCPGVPAQLAVTLACKTMASGNASVLHSPPLLLATSPSEFGFLACSSADAGTVTVLTPMSVQLLPPFGTPSFVASVICNLTGSDGSAMGSAALSVDVQATLWPTFDDAIVVLSNGFSRSVTDLGPRRLNATAALLAVLAGLPAIDAVMEGHNVTRRTSVAVPTTSFSAHTTDSSQSSFDDVLAAAVSDPATVLGAIQSIWGAVILPEADAAARPFSLTLFDATPLVLRSRTRSFADGTEVFVGEVRCNGTVVSADGEWLSTVAPSPNALCGSSSCAYATLIVRNPASTVSPSSDTLRGASLTCPPFCAGSVGGVVFPFVPGSNATAVPATLDETGTLAVPLDLATASVAATGIQVAASAGLFYSEACSSAGIYTDPSSGSCTNASDPAAALCAFGGGSSCRPCPAGALCPGGFRAWPQRGYWSPTESSAKVAACIQPFAAAKCLGWSPALSASQCGPGYRQGSYLCSACAPDYYLYGDGSCAACPVSPSLWTQYAGLFTLLALVACFVFAVYILLVIVVLAAGFSIRNFVRDVLTLLMHCFTIIQVLSTVAQVGSARIPPLLRWLYEGVSLLQFQGITLPPACTRSYPFVTDVSLISVATGLWLAAVAAAQLRQVLGDRPWRSAVYVFATAAVYLHPTASASALRLLNCRSVQLSAAAVAALEDSSGNAAPVIQPYSAAASTTTVSVISSNPFIPCFGALHTPAGGLAIAALLAYNVAMPLLTLFWISRDPWLATELSPETNIHHESTQTPPLQPQLLQKDDRRRSSLIVPTSLSVIVCASDVLQAAAPGPVPSPPPQAPQLREPPRRDTMLHPFLRDSGYTPQGWFWRHIDIGIVFGLVAVNSFLPTPETPVQAIAKLAVTLVLLVALALALAALRNPYKEPWKRPVRLAIIALSAACACINAASRTLDLGYGGPVLAACITPGAYVILGILLVTVAVLLVGFGRDVVRQALRRARPAETAPTSEEPQAIAALHFAYEQKGGETCASYVPPPLLAIPSLVPSSDRDPSSSVVSPSFSAVDFVTSDRVPDDSARAAEVLTMGAPNSHVLPVPPDSDTSARVPIGSSSESWRTRDHGLQAWGSEDGIESSRGTDRVVSVRNNALVPNDDTNRDTLSQLRLAPPQRQRPPRVPSWFAEGTSTSRTQSSADSSLPSSVVCISANLQPQQQRQQPVASRYHTSPSLKLTQQHRPTSTMRRVLQEESFPVQNRATGVSIPVLGDGLSRDSDHGDHQAGGRATSIAHAFASPSQEQHSDHGSRASESESTCPRQPATGSLNVTAHLDSHKHSSFPSAARAGARDSEALSPATPQQCHRIESTGLTPSGALPDALPEAAGAAAPTTQTASPEDRTRGVGGGGENLKASSPLQRPDLNTRRATRLSAAAALSHPRSDAGGAWAELTTAAAAARGRRASFAGDNRASTLTAVAKNSASTADVVGLQHEDGGQFPRRRRSSLLVSATTSITFDPRH